MSVRGLIYVIANNVNDKVYIGQTTQLLKARFRDHCNLRKSIDKSAIRAAIHKHGIESFRIEQIDSAESIDELNRKEVYWIGRRNSLAPNGYNISLGGEAGGLRTESTKAKLSKMQKGKPSAAVWTDKARNRMSLKMTGRGNHRFGISVSESTRAKMSASHKGIPTPATCVKVRCVDTGVIYDSVIATSRAIGISHQHLNRLLNSGRVSVKYRLSFERFLSTNNPTGEELFQ